MAIVLPAVLRCVCIIAVGAYTETIPKPVRRTMGTIHSNRIRGVAPP